jgi:hypothetical protein
MTRYFFYSLTVTVLFLWSALSDKGMNLSFDVYAAGPCQRSLSRVRLPWDSRPYLTSLFVASYDSQGHDGGIQLVI